MRLWGVGPVTAGKAARARHRAAGRRAQRRSERAARHGRQPGRLAAAARPRRRRSAGGAEPGSEVLGFGEHLPGGSHRSRRRSAPRSPRWPARRSPGWRGGSGWRAPSRSRSATTTSPPSPAATPRRRRATSRELTARAIRLLERPTPAAGRCGCSASACTISVRRKATIDPERLPFEGNTEDTKDTKDTKDTQETKDTE